MSFGQGELVFSIFETMAENIHDRFFKDNFSQRHVAVAFIEELFPAELSEKIDLSTQLYPTPTLNTGGVGVG